MLPCWSNHVPECIPGNHSTLFSIIFLCFTDEYALQSLPKLLNCCKLQFFTGNLPQYWSHLVSELRKQWFTMARTQEAILKTQHNQSLQFIRIQKPTCINYWFLLGYHFINLGSQHRKGLPLTCAEWYWGQYSVLEGRCWQRRGRIWDTNFSSCYTYLYLRQSCTPNSLKVPSQTARSNESACCCSATVGWSPIS